MASKSAFFVIAPYRFGALSLLLALLSRSFAPAAAAAPADLPGAPLALSSRANQMSCSLGADGVYSIETAGGDPYVFVENFVSAHDPSKPYIVAFEYRVDADPGKIAFYYALGGSVKHIAAAAPPSEDWRWLFVDLSRDGQGLGDQVEWFRIDFGLSAGLRFKVRNLRLIEATPEARLRAALGDKADDLGQFGISLAGVEPQASSMETARYAGERAAGVVLSVYRFLDLDAQTKAMRDDPAAQPPVALGPRIAAGEGEHPDNHTVIRILSPFQVCEVQFLAFPPGIRGGVGVESGKLLGQGACIAAWPLASDQTREIRIFDRHGGWLAAFEAGEPLRPPFSIAVGDFRPDRPGDEIAIASRHPRTPDEPVLIATGEGEWLASLPVESQAGATERRLLAKRGGGSDVLILQFLEECAATALAPAEKRGQSWALGGLPPGSRLFDSIYSDRLFNAGGPQKTISTLHAMDESGAARSFDAGRMENILWFYKQKAHGGSVATWPPIDDGRYIRNGHYNFLGGAMTWSPLVASGDIENKSYEEWTAGADWSKAGGPYRKALEQYDEGVPTVWPAVFTHRWASKPMAKIVEKTDPATGLPLYLLLDRKNEPQGGGYFGQRLFDYGSYNFEQEALEKLYTYCQREFYRRLAALFRANPEMTIAVEPNHENEIVSGPQSAGDYNPKNIEGFYRYLAALHGDIESIAARFGAPFDERFFDPPRGFFRGEWDRCHQDNPLFREWIEYNRTVVHRRVGVSYREALMAGFPPELIKCHQIPDSYVFGSIVGISEGEYRISPIDWLLTTGAGFGFSRYGTYYEQPHNIGQGAHSSGYDGMLIGEYASLNPSVDKAYGQLKYLREHGVAAMHVMWWPEHLDKGFNAAQDEALRRLIANDDRPKPGYAGGIGQVRPYRGAAGAFDIASLGTQPENTGLIKSLRQDGSFEGSVYVTPFHAHVEIAELRKPADTAVGAEGASVCVAEGLRPGAAIEIAFETAEASPGSEAALYFEHEGRVLDDKTVRLAGLRDGQRLRVVYKIPLPMGGVALRLAAPKGEFVARNLSAVLHQEQAVCLSLKIMEGKRHQGGVEFAILDE